MNGATVELDMNLSTARPTLHNTMPDTTTSEANEFFEIRNLLFDELVMVADLLAQYRFLFLESPERVARLNDHADWFFATVQRTFAQQLMLSISRITDPAESSGRRNVSFAALLEDPRVAANLPLQDVLTRLVANVTMHAGPIRRYRNRAIGHLDQKAAFGHEPLPNVSLSLFEQVLESLTEIHLKYSVEILDRGASYDIHPLKSAEALVELLELAPTRKEWVLRKKLVELRERSVIENDQGTQDT